MARIKNPLTLVGSGGGLAPAKPEERKTVPLSMGSGNQVITPTDGSVLVQVTVEKPVTLIADNIKNGVNIGGVTGNYIGGTAMPTLNRVSTTRNGTSFTITNPSSNGNFVTGYKIYDNGNLIATITSTSYSLTGLDVGTHSIMVAAKGNNFNDAPGSTAFIAKMLAITNELTNLTNSNSAVKILDGQTYSAKLVPNEGKYLPEAISVTADGEPVEYIYDEYAGTITVANVQGDISVEAVAWDTLKLHTPKLVLANDGRTLDMQSVRYATQLHLYANEVEVFSVIDYKNCYVEAIEGVTYGFELNANGYYESTNKGKPSSYALCKVVLSSSSEATAKFECINSGESSYDFGILSKLDTELARSNTEDSSTLYAANFKGKSSTSPQPIVSYTIPNDGQEHFVYVKYRKDGGGDNGNDSLQFKVTLE